MSDRNSVPASSTHRDGNATWRALHFGTLRGSQRWLHGVFAFAFLLVCANTLFLLGRRYGFGCALDDFDGCNVSIFYQSMVLGHSAIGIVMSLALAGFVLLHISRNWRMAVRRTAVLGSGLGVLTLLIFLLVSGLYFLLRAKTGANAWLFYSHMGAAAIVIAVYFLHRHLVRPYQTRASSRAMVLACASIAAVMIIGEFVGAPATDAPIRAASLSADDGSYQPPTAVRAGYPFFPSPVQIASGAVATEPEKIVGQWPENPDAIRREVEEQGFATAVPIGAEKCARCHAGVTETWKRSAHRFSSFNNPYYVATIDFLRNNTPDPNGRLSAHLQEVGIDIGDAGKIKSQWCAGCHDPALMLSGQFRGEIDRGSVAAQAGLTCLACHRITEIPNHTGNGNFVWNDRDQDSYILSEAEDPLRRELHDVYLSANPERHRADMLRPFYSKSEFCATCHKVSLDVAVNDYRWLRGQNEYDAWHSSGVAHNAARTFYLPPTARECQACHMPLVQAEQPDRAADPEGRIRSHSFGAANTALPFIRGDDGAIARIEEFLRDGRLRIHFAGVQREDGLGLLGEDPQSVDALEMHLVVRNLGVGHTFPGGTNDSNESWVQFTLKDGNGEQIASIGEIRPDGEVSFDTRFYSALPVDRHGNRIEKRNAQDMIAAAYIKVIPPGTADVVRVAVPGELLEGRTGPFKVVARLLWRKFHQAYNRFAFENNRTGFGRFDAPPELPVTEIDRAVLTISGEPGGPYQIRPEALHPIPEIGLHDYAIGFLRQGDTAHATEAIAASVATNPECWNCRRTEIAVALRAGDFVLARELLVKLEADEPRNPQTAWHWARLLIEEGRYTQADQALAVVLKAFPSDREALKLRARNAYLDGRHDQSMMYAEDALDIDPEDATAHYYAMLAAKGLGDVARAQTFNAAFVYHQRDEAAQEVTRTFRAKNPAVNFAAQDIQVFELK